MNKPIPKVLQNMLNILEPYLKLKDVYEISIYQPGEIWLDRLDGDKEKVIDPNLTDTNLHFLGICLASYYCQKFSEEHPLLAVGIPEHKARIHILQPPLVKNIAISIRSNHQKRRQLDNFFKLSPTGSQDLKRFLEIVATRKNFLVAGGASTGKTSFLNALFNAAATHERIVTIEDTEELSFASPQVHAIQVSRSGSSLSGRTEADAVNDARRMNPDRIVLGEISIRSARPFLSALNNGKAGCATIHANSAEDAYISLAQNVDLDGGSYDAALKLAKHLIPAVIYLERARAKIKAILIEIEHHESLPKKKIIKTESFLEHLTDNIDNNNYKQLSQSELELSEFLVKGFTLSDVARARGVPYKTISQERDEIIQKLQILPGIRPAKPVEVDQRMSA